LGDGAAEAGQGAEFLGEGLGDFAVPMVEEGGVAAGEDGGEMVDEAGAVLVGSGLREFGGVHGQVLGLTEELGVNLPGKEAAGAPFAEVLFADGVAVELGGEDGLDLGEGVEPGEEGLARLGVGEAVVELGAKGFGEAGDFAVARGAHNTNGES
jgi:hypothetical protein